MLLQRLLPLDELRIMNSCVDAAVRKIVGVSCADICLSNRPACGEDCMGELIRRRTDNFMDGFCDSPLPT